MALHCVDFDDKFPRGGAAVAVVGMDVAGTVVAVAVVVAVDTGIPVSLLVVAGDDIALPLPTNCYIHHRLAPVLPGCGHGFS